MRRDTTTSTQTDLEMDSGNFNESSMYDDASCSCDRPVPCQTIAFTNNGKPVTMETEYRKRSFVDSGIGNSNSVNNLCQQFGSIGMEDDVRARPEIIEDFRKCAEPSITVDGPPSCRDVDAITVFSQDADGDTLLHVAIILKNLSLAMHFINKAPSHMWLSMTNLLWQTPLILAVLTRQIDVVRRLVVGGADLTSRDRDGNTALAIACREGYTDIAQALLNPVRYVETKQNTYEIPYQKQNLDIANFEGLTCLHLAAASGHLDIVELLLRSGADINAKDAKVGRTALHNACIDGNMVLVKYLLTCKDCNINARTFDDFTPFDLARARGHNDVIIELATTGARYSEANS